MEKTQIGQSIALKEQGDFHMAKMLTKAMSLFETIGRARAAHQLVMMGKHQEAKELFTENK